MQGLLIDNTLCMTNLPGAQLTKAHGLTIFGKAGPIQWNGQLNYSVFHIWTLIWRNLIAAFSCSSCGELSRKSILLVFGDR